MSGRLVRLEDLLSLSALTNMPKPNLLVHELWPFFLAYLRGQVTHKLARLPLRC